MRKIASDSLNAEFLRKNFNTTVQQLLAQDKAYRLMCSIKGTPPHWKRTLYEVLAMVRQLGIPTFSTTFSCADLQWNKLIRII